MENVLNLKEQFNVAAIEKLKSNIQYVNDIFTHFNLPFAIRRNTISRLAQMITAQAKNSSDPVVKALKESAQSLLVALNSTDVIPEEKDILGIPLISRLRLFRLPLRQ